MLNMEFIVHVTITTILVSSTFVQLITACPEKCYCNRTQVSCAAGTIFTVPGDIPSESELVSLELPDNYISSLTNVFHNLTSLQKLDLHDNQISAIQQADFQNNTNLRWLNIQSNSITEIHPDAFRPLTNLTFLTLANNSLSVLPRTIFQRSDILEYVGVYGDSITNLSEVPIPDTLPLAILDLSFNEIRDIDYIFESMTSLQMVNLSNNKVKVIDGQYFHGNNTISHLNLSHNDILSVLNMSSLIHLQTLDLSWNNITYISPTTFEGLLNLTELVLDGNMIGNITSPLFKGLQSLHMLSLSMMPNLKYLSPHAFQGLDRLSILNFHHNRLLSFIHKDLFLPLKSISIIDISFNEIMFLNSAIMNNTQLTSLDLRGNKLNCDCYIEWLLNSTESNSSIIKHADELKCVNSPANKTMKLTDIDIEDLHCSEVNIIKHSPDSQFKIGRSAILQCIAEGAPSPEILWITPGKRTLYYHNIHEYSSLDYLPFNDSTAHAQFHKFHEWHEQSSYYSEREDRSDRIVILEDGSLYIDYVMRTDAGPYRCIAKNSRNQTEIVITLTLNYNVLTEVKLWSLVVGGACAGGFFLLNLIYSLSLAAVRRCISQRRRERIRQIIETMDQYKTHQLTRIKENYNHQVGRIRDQYHYQLGRLREHHHSQVGRMGRMREGASQKVEKLRDNYNNQLGRLKDYSSTQLVQIREKYNNQVDKIKDYGNDKLDRIHEKYKLKQQHVIKLLEMMNMENCKTVFESECVRTESMILDSDTCIFTADVPIHSPLDSDSVSDSEYLTATSSESSKYTSKENLYLKSTRKDISTENSVINVSQTELTNPCETYQIVNEEHKSDDSTLNNEATASQATGGSQSDLVNVANISTGRKTSKSKGRDGSKKWRSRSDMVLKLPQDDNSDDQETPAATSKKYMRRHPSSGSRARATGNTQYNEDIDALLKEQPSTSGLGEEPEDIDALLNFPGKNIRESTV